MENTNIQELKASLQKSMRGFHIHSISTAIGLMEITPPSSLPQSRAQTQDGKRLQKISSQPSLERDSEKSLYSQRIYANIKPNEPYEDLGASKTRLLPLRKQMSADRTQELLNLKEKTIAELNQKLKEKSEKEKPMMNTNFFLNESLTNLNLGGEIDMNDIKRLLLKQISKSNRLNETLNNRCVKLKEMLDLFETNIQFNDMLFLKDKDINRLNELIKHLSSTLASTSQTEIDLNLKGRELEKAKHELSYLKSKYEGLEKRNMNLELEIRSLKESLRISEENQKKNFKTTIAEKNKAQVIAKRMDGLEKGILLLKEQNLTQEDDNKLKNTINILLRQNQEFKKDLNLAKRISIEKDNEIGRLKAKIGRLTLRIEEMKGKNNIGGNLANIFSNNKDEGQAANKKASTLGRGSVQSQPQSFATTPKIKKKFTRSNTKFYVNMGSENTSGMIGERSEDFQSLDFRIKKFPKKLKSALDELNEYGIEPYVDYIVTQEQSIAKSKLSLIIEYFLDGNELLEKVHDLCDLFIGMAGHMNFLSTINITKERMRRIFQCKRATLWIKDFTNNDLWTIEHDKELRYSINKELIGRVAQTGFSIITSHLEFNEDYDENYDSMFNEKRNNVAIIAIKDPDGKVLGVLETANSVTNFDLDEQFMSELVGNFLGAVLAKINSEQPMITELNAMEALKQANLETMSCKNKRDLSNVIEASLKAIFGVNMASFLTVEDDSFIKYSESDKQIKIKAGIAGDVYVKEKPQIIQNPYNDVRFNSNVDINTSLPIYCFPIADTSTEGAGDVVGVVQFINRSLKNKEKGEKEEVEIEPNVYRLMMDFGDTISLALRNIKFYELLYSNPKNARQMEELEKKTKLAYRKNFSTKKITMIN